MLRRFGPRHLAEALLQRALGWLLVRAGLMSKE